MFLWRCNPVTKLFICVIQQISRFYPLQFLSPFPMATSLRAWRALSTRILVNSLLPKHIQKTLNFAARLISGRSHTHSRERRWSLTLVTTSATGGSSADKLPAWPGDVQLQDHYFPPPLPASWYLTAYMHV